ncbi:PQQ-dependent sugar dehydrogenase [Hymenobacter antarcticus]|uniref:Sorbosone dehydrogenase family protein n=1 Tax=Hymenobacter antarcticus TaxID=486270 RepID=A0ABP7Q4W8_9BACT
MRCYLLATALLLSLAACNKNNDPEVDPATQDFPTEVLQPVTTTVRLVDLPAPFASTSATNFPQVLAARPANARLRVPQGYAVNIFAEAPNARWMTVAPNGDIFLAQPSLNQITVLRDANRDGRVDETFVWDAGGVLFLPHGMAFDGNFLYVGNTNSIIRYAYSSGQTRASGAATQLAVLPGGGNHVTRTLLIHNNKIYAAVGSAKNVGIEDDVERASVQQYNLDGTGRVTYASGLRNPVGLALNPQSNAIWTVVNERDGLGDELVPDYATALVPNAFYGYPYAYLAPGNRDPRITATSPLTATTRTPDILFKSHSAPLGLAFYTGTAFPADARGDAYVAFHGSWNRSAGTGYKVVRLKMNAQGQPEGGYEDFITGWHLNADQPGTPQVFGRPVSIVTASDGSLLVSDAVAGIIWRVRYRGN